MRVVSMFARLLAMASMRWRWTFSPEALTWIDVKKSIVRILYRIRVSARRPPFCGDGQCLQGFKANSVPNAREFNELAGFGGQDGKAFKTKGLRAWRRGGHRRRGGKSGFIWPPGKSCCHLFGDGQVCPAGHGKANEPLMSTDRAPPGGGREEPQINTDAHR
ncbi:hypothetical protein NITGR_310041 [Nitrospina gracilis 3/211]|uniref:Uncharacterized protein n=1 Tax=Nitrospina gracilis (strain 3/211) TaxID=1266370 RepID=M1YZ73_NITG3|nr:hypothetical protein NITGR_310041 [Nitrospina gracilis 3/211]